MIHPLHLPRSRAFESHAVTYVKEDILQMQDNLLQLFSINHDFTSAWHAFVSAPTDAQRKLELILDKNNFPYWTKPSGMEDSLTATFSIIDWKKKRLTLAASTIQFSGDEITGWQLTINNTNQPIFAFTAKA